MMTERYMINFDSVGGKPFCMKDVTQLWAAAAANEKASSGCFVNAVVDKTVLICDADYSCGDDSSGVRVVSTRNPVIDENSRNYFDSITRVILEVKKRLDNPPVGITIVSVNYYYFQG